MKICRGCKDPFEPKTPWNLYCSIKCRTNNANLNKDNSLKISLYQKRKAIYKQEPISSNYSDWVDYS